MADLTKQEPYISLAEKAIREFFKRRKSPFHFRQLQVLFETQFFHITTAQAIYRLTHTPELSTKRHVAGANRVTFVFPSSLLKADKERKTLETHIKSKASVIAKYDNPNISRDLAQHFEALVKSELRACQLTIISTHSNTYKDRRWTATKANLDFIAEYPDGRAFGVQAKNELKSIEKDELELQLDICSTLGILPLFIVRYMPFSFVPLIRARQGFLCVMGNQLWPIGHRDLCENIKIKLSISESQISAKLRKLTPKIRTDWPIEVQTEIAVDHFKRLKYWIDTGNYPDLSLPTT